MHNDVLLTRAENVRKDMVELSAAMTQCAADVTPCSRWAVTTISYKWATGTTKKNRQKKTSRFTDNPGTSMYSVYRLCQNYTG